MMSLIANAHLPTDGHSSTPEQHHSGAHDSSRLSYVLANLRNTFSWSRPPPIFVATTSRGSIPHLTPDNIGPHTKIPSAHIGLEDFITTPAHKSAILSIPTPLQNYLALPEQISLFFSARKANPVPINASWNDKLEVHTVDGRSSLPIDTFINAVKQVRIRPTDVVISIPDTTESPGTKRLLKMVQRTQNWLELLLESSVTPSLSVS